MENDNLPSDRFEAARLGLKKYRTGRTCKNGHSGPRYTSNGVCVECLADKNKALREQIQKLRQDASA